MRVPAAGGLPTSLAALGFLNFGFDWGDDGTLYFADDRDHIVMARLWAIPPEGGEPRRVNSLDSSPPNVSHSWPAILPDGDEILFAEWQHDEQSMELVAVETRSGRRHPLFPGSQPRYCATGHLIFTRPGSLWAAPFEPKSLAVLGPAVEIADDVATSPLTGRADYALSADGTLVYRRRVAPADAALFWIDRRGERSPVPVPSGRYDDVSLSPDGRKVALVNIADGSIRILDLASGAATRIALEESLTILPVWSRDSRQVAVLAVGAGAFTPFASTPAATRSCSLRCPLQAECLFKPGRVARSSQRLSRSGGVERVERRRLLAPRPAAEGRASPRDPFSGEPPRSLTGRTLAGVRVGRVRAARGLHPLLCGSRRGTLAGVARWRVATGMESRWRSALPSPRRPHPRGYGRRGGRWPAVGRSRGSVPATRLDPDPVRGPPRLRDREGRPSTRFGGRPAQLAANGRATGPDQELREPVAAARPRRLTARSTPHILWANR